MFHIRTLCKSLQVLYLFWSFYYIKKPACSWFYSTTNHKINFHSRNKLFDLMSTSFKLIRVGDSGSLVKTDSALTLIHGWPWTLLLVCHLHLRGLDILVGRCSESILGSWQGGCAGPDAASEFRHTHWPASGERFHTPCWLHHTPLLLEPVNSINGCGLQIFVLLPLSVFCCGQCWRIKSSQRISKSNGGDRPTPKWVIMKHGKCLFGGEYNTWEWGWLTSSGWVRGGC